MTIEDFYEALRRTSPELYKKGSADFDRFLQEEVNMAPIEVVDISSKWQALMISAFLQSKGINMPDLCLTPFGLSVHAKVVENKMRMLEGSIDNVQIHLAG